MFLFLCEFCISPFVPQKFYQSVFLMLGAALIASGISIYHRNNTTLIYVSSDFLRLSCPDLSVTHPNIVTHRICSFDQRFNLDNEAQRAEAFELSIHLLEFSLVMRHDIAQYFYRKIIDGNPDDALSVYVRKYKIKDRI